MKIVSVETGIIRLSENNMKKYHRQKEKLILVLQELGKFEYTQKFRIKKGEKKDQNCIFLFSSPVKKGLKGKRLTV